LDGFIERFLFRCIQIYFYNIFLIFRIKLLISTAQAGQLEDMF